MADEGADLYHRRKHLRRVLLTLASIHAQERKRADNALGEAIAEVDDAWEDLTKLEVANCNLYAETQRPYGWNFWRRLKFLVMGR